MCYVPNYLTCVEREITGWPKGLTDEQKAWLVEFCRYTLYTFGGTLSLNAVYDFYKYRDDRPKLGALLDFTFAALDRALREVANPTWTLKQ